MSEQSSQTVDRTETEAVQPTMRRSQLATPGSDETMVQKAPQSGADEAFLDLEDAVAPGEKVDARETVIEGLRDGEWTETRACFRMNGVDTEWWYDDVIQVVGAAGESVDTIMVPMCHDASTVQTVDNLLTQVEANEGLPEGEIGLQCQIESASGMTNVAEIARASDRMESLVFGPGDYTASVGAAGLTIGSGGDYPGHYWHYQLARIAHAAKAEGLQVIDGPYAEIEDPEGFRESCRNASLLGCDGKWAVHPSQIEIANETFAPDREEAERARRIVEAYAEATAQGKGAVSVDGEMVDEATNKMARRLVARAEAAGVL
ncbi:CoA ester lyase [Halogeometricum sp. S1BR25-6]|uniref:CoA ester lyase n=1 Tax=Halogeometricum salsisoli TaxID=2950536 RepID=A0ABU2GGB5_9EURY|nr:CoA ester lyase [Halogeometricum sp. S1BR25-6]MDS0299851.1 CoA ester lyase [Halogeometricum sp. S1BR25-6]